MRRASVPQGYSRQVSSGHGLCSHLLDFIGFCGGGLIHRCKKCGVVRYSYDNSNSQLLPAIYCERRETEWREPSA